MNYIPHQMLTQVMKARWMKWARHVANMGERGEMHTQFGWKNLTKTDRLEDLGV